MLFLCVWAQNIWVGRVILLYYQLAQLAQGGFTSLCISSSGIPTGLRVALRSYEGYRLGEIDSSFSGENWSSLLSKLS